MKIHSAVIVLLHPNNHYGKSSVFLQRFIVKPPKIKTCNKQSVAQITNSKFAMVADNS
jgi:hypothetical protein